MIGKWKTEEIWREALWGAREQLRHMELESADASRVARKRHQVERIRAAGLPEWRERTEWAGFSYPIAR